MIFKEPVKMSRQRFSAATENNRIEEKTKSDLQPTAMFPERFQSARQAEKSFVFFVNEDRRRKAEFDN